MMMIFDRASLAIFMKHNVQKIHRETQNFHLWNFSLTSMFSWTSCFVLNSIRKNTFLSRRLATRENWIYGWMESIILIIMSMIIWKKWDTDFDFEVWLHLGKKDHHQKLDCYLKIQDGHQHMYVHSFPSLLRGSFFAYSLYHNFSK